MSYIEQFGVDLDTLSALLGEWISRAGDTSETLTAGSAETVTRTEALGAELRDCERRSSELQAGASALAGACRTLEGELASETTACAQAAAEAASHWRSQADALSTQADKTCADAAAASASLTADSLAVKQSYSAWSQARASYGEATEGHHASAHAAIGTGSATVAAAGAHAGEAAQTARQGLDGLTGELSAHLSGPLHATVTSVTGWMEQDLRSQLSSMVQARLAETSQQLTAYRGQVQTFHGDLEQAGAALMQVVEKLVHDLPDTVRKQGIDPLVRLAGDLVLNKLVETLTVICVSASLSTACVGAMPVLKVISATLKALLQLSSLAETGQLRNDLDNGAGGDDLEGAAAGLRAGQEPDQGVLIGQLNAAIDQLNTHLAAIDNLRQQAVDGVVEVVNQGAMQVQDFVEELFCPICGGPVDLVPDDAADLTGQAA